MSKTIYIKLTKSSLKAGPFKILDGEGNTIEELVTRNELISGKTYIVGSNVTVVTLVSLGKCLSRKSFGISEIYPSDIVSYTYTPIRNSCLWVHLKNTVIYNIFYDYIEPYIIEYPFSYQYNDEILQSVQDYTKVFKYFPSIDGSVYEYNKIEIDNYWFNKAIVYNGQQSSGILNLVSKPINNLKQYLQYPIYEVNGKSIIFTKSDNIYQYNTFWSLVKDKTTPLFIRSCESLSIDKIVNQSNMDYSVRTYKKEPFRAKDSKIRHILDNRSDIHLVSQFIVESVQTSFK